MQKCVKKKRVGLTTSDKIDRIVTNRFLALPIFAAVMFLVYFLSIMSVGDFVTGWTNDVLFGELIGGNLGAWMEGVGERWWPVFGAAYFLVAVKRVRGMRLVGLARHEARKASNASAVVANRQRQPEEVCE